MACAVDYSISRVRTVDNRKGVHVLEAPVRAGPRLPHSQCNHAVRHPWPVFSERQLDGMKRDVIRSVVLVEFIECVEPVERSDVLQTVIVRAPIIGHVGLCGSLQCR
jgi:hypothetical protein